MILKNLEAFTRQIADKFNDASTQNVLENWTHKRWI